MEPVSNPEAAIEFEELLRRAALLQGASGQRQAEQGSGDAAMPKPRQLAKKKERSDERKK